MRAALPLSAKKVAHYYYTDGNELAVYVTTRSFHIRDGKTGHFPISPITKKRDPHPNEGKGFATEYEVLGLYYGYAMAGSGWDGDC